MPPVGWIGLSSARSTLPSGSGGAMWARFSRHGLAGHRQAIAVHQTGIQQRLHHHGHTADVVDVEHHVLAERFHVRQVRHLLADAGEVLQRQLDVGLVGDRQQMQHRIGRAAERHHHRDRVLERLLGEDVAGGDAAAQQFDDGLPAAPGEPVAPAVGGRRGGAARQRHADRLGGTGHGVGGVHAAARALAGADRPLDRVDVLARHQAAGARADRLERVDDRDVHLGAVGELGLAGQDRARRRGTRWPGRAGRRPSACRAATCHSRPAAPNRRGARPA